MNALLLLLLFWAPSGFAQDPCNPPATGLEDLATERGQNVARVRSEYEKDNGLDALRRRIREDKTLDLLMSKANIIIEESKEEPEQPEPAPAEPEKESEKEAEEDSE